jgi:Ca2+:H+ antiporter
MRHLLSLNTLLVFLPLTAWLHYATGYRTAEFICACLSIIPLAGWMGRATEHLAERTSDAIGGLLNATFGNAAELVIALVALASPKDMHAVVKASITGSIIGNILLVMGAAFLAGGVKFRVQTFNPAGVGSTTTTLSLAAIALVIPALFHQLEGRPVGDSREQTLSLGIAVVLLVTYAASLLFTLHTHKQLFISAAPEPQEGGRAAPWSVGRSLGVLAGATALVAWVSEMLVGSVEHAAHTLGMSNVFIGVVVVAIIGNAAEHSTAVLAALKDRMDLAIGIAVGSSAQIALFVAPVLVLASYALGPHPLDLVFTSAEVVAVVIAVHLAHLVTNDGESHWLEGVQLLSVYAMLGLVFYFLPG